MIRPPEFALLEIATLREHEEVEASQIPDLARRLIDDGAVRDPIWVAREGLVILNGHHRVRALRALGARRVPAWLVDYDDPRIVLERWSTGPPIAKSEVVARAREGRLFPPKTTRHTLRFELAQRSTPLGPLFDGPVPSAMAAEGAASR